MRKRMIEQDIQKTPATKHQWLNLQKLAQVEITSEDQAHPIEAALLPGGGSWRAAQTGKQTLRLLFDTPQRIELVRLVFEEQNVERTQEFLLRWSPDGESWHDIARQQYNFSSPDSTHELEDYHVDLDGVMALDLCVIPDISGGSARASLAEWRIA